MGLKECLITFDNSYNTYYEGQTVNGQVTIILDSPKKIRGFFEILDNLINKVSEIL